MPDEEGFSYGRAAIIAYVAVPLGCSSPTMHQSSLGVALPRWSWVRTYAVAADEPVRESPLQQQAKQTAGSPCGPELLLRACRRIGACACPTRAEGLTAK